MRILHFVSVVTGNPLVSKLSTLITKDEWITKILSSQTMKSLGLRGSPKLSKVLLGMGLSPNLVSNILSTPRYGEIVVTGDPAIIEQQGNSIHFSSCQANDSRAKWFSTQPDESWDKVWQELDVCGKSLFMAYIGKPMEEDGEGFLFRCKLRLMYFDKKFTKIAGLFLDRPYGQVDLVHSNLYQVAQWWEDYSESKGWDKTPLLIPPLWQTSTDEGRDLQQAFAGTYSTSLYCPSAKVGYQDCLLQGQGPYDCFSAISVNSPSSLLKTAYLIRSKQPIAQRVALSDCSYNPQKGGLIVPSISNKPWRGFITREHRFWINALREVFGWRVRSFKWKHGHYFKSYSFVLGENSYTLKQGDSCFSVVGDHSSLVANVEYSPLQEGEISSLKQCYLKIEVFQDIAGLLQPCNITAFILSYQFRLGEFVEGVWKPLLFDRVWYDRHTSRVYEYETKKADDGTTFLLEKSGHETKIASISEDGSIYTVLCNNIELGLMVAIPMPPLVVGRHKECLVYDFDGRLTSDISDFRLCRKAEPYISGDLRKWAKIEFLKETYVAACYCRTVLSYSKGSMLYEGEYTTLPESYLSLFRDTLYKNIESDEEDDWYVQEDEPGED